MYTDYFSYLPWTGILEWDGGKMVSVPEFSKVQEWIEKHANPDGYLYPPLVYDVILKQNGDSEKVPGTKRPAHMYKLPNSHKIELLNIKECRESARKGIAGFLIHFTGCLFGYRCQFEGWWVDGRIPTRSKADYHLFDLKHASKYFDRAVKTWCKWSERDQKVAINALFLHNRAPSYEWDWERFLAEYQVLDAAYALAKRCYGVSAHRHEDRMKALCNHFGLALDKDQISKIVNLRNNLIHEALWAEGMPGEAPKDGTDYLTPFWIHRFNNRLLFALLDIRSDYIRTKWWLMGQWGFEPQ